MDVSALPVIDEHAVTVGAAPEIVWRAALEVFRGFDGLPASVVARLLGCDPRTTTGWESAARGATVPGFRVEDADPPRRLVLSGRHRFSHYALVVHVDAVPAGARCRFESRAAFPGVHGRLYRLAVVSTRGHVLAVRRLLHQVATRAEGREAA